MPLLFENPPVVKQKNDYYLQIQNLKMFWEKNLMFVMTGPCSFGSRWIRNPSRLLVHGSLCGDAAESWSSSGALRLQDIWFHPITGMNEKNVYLKLAGAIL